MHGVRRGCADLSCAGSGVRRVLCQCEEVGAHLFRTVVRVGLTRVGIRAYASGLRACGQMCVLYRETVVRDRPVVMGPSRLWVVPVHVGGFEREKGIRWMPWHQEAMKDVARCEKPWGAASRL